MEGPTAIQHIGGAVISTLFHPIGYAKVLIQLGHEPLAPYPTKTIFRNDTLTYPNVFKYVSHIRATDGFFGCYRGVVPRLLGGVVTSVVQQAVAESFPPDEEEEASTEKGAGLLLPIKAVCIKASKETVVKGVAIIASQPFHVIMVRSMAQFVGGESKYSGLTSAIGEIYNNDGILGFFAGLVPRLIGEALTVWLANILAHVMNTYFIEDKSVQCYTGAACGMIVTHLTYPFSLVSNLMAVKGSGLVATTPPQMPVYESWTDCWTQLSHARQLKRGSNMFFRYYTGPFTLSGGKMVALDYAFSS